MLLREKIRIVFREQDVTIGVVLTAIGAVVTSIVEGVKAAAIFCGGDSARPTKSIRSTKAPRYSRKPKKCITLACRKN